METANASTSSAATDEPVPAEDAAVRAAKRYEGLVTVRTKAVKGKGAWYWAHLEPILVHSSDTGLPKAVKLRCSLCDNQFSASNPSRTASEHLKRGTCPNFASPSAAVGGSGGGCAGGPHPISSIAPCSSAGRKRPASPYLPLALTSGEAVYSSSSTPPLSAPAPAPLMLSGGKEDLGALAMFEDSVKKLKSPKASPGPALSKAQADTALSLLADWFYESAGAVPFSAADHPKFRAFLHQVGLPPFSRRDLAGARLDARCSEARADADARIRDAHFFQLASDGWAAVAAAGGGGGSGDGGDYLVSLSLNLPNGSSIFRRAVFTPGPAPSKYAEEILWDTLTGLGDANRCVGIVADRFKSKALRNLENKHHWMVNLSCQLHGFRSLIKDMATDLPLFRTVSANCLKLASFFNTNSRARIIYNKYQLKELDHVGLIRVSTDLNSLAPVVAMMDDILASARPIQLAVHDEAYKLACMEDPNAGELAEMVRDVRFWTDLEAVHSLVKLVKDMIQEMEVERPLVGQCLPLWDELRSKVKDWCDKFGVDEGLVSKVLDKRFKKNYHPAWSAAFILDPLYMIKDSSGKYLPPFKCLTPEQEKDVDKLIMRLVSREEAHIALMELMKWRSEGLNPLYAQAVQVKQVDPTTGKMRVANPQGSRIVWETYLSEFKSLGKVASRLIFLHATTCGFKCNVSLLRWACAHGRSRAGMDRAQKMVFVAAHAKPERRDTIEEERDAELFANGDDDVLNEAFGDASSL